MILVVNFNFIENSMLEKVATDVGIADRCRYLDGEISSTRELISVLDDTKGVLPRVVIVNLDSADADWKSLVTDLKADKIWRFVPILGFSFLDDPATMDMFYALGGTSCIKKPHGYDGLKAITESAIGYWLDVSFLPCDFIDYAA